VIKKINHIGLAVHSIAKALEVFRDALGLQVERTELIEDQGVKVAFLPLEGIHLELLEPIDETGPVARFLRRKGQGVHHVCLEVDDIEAVLSALQQRGVRLVDERPRIGAGGIKIAFLHPSSTRGILLELCEESK